MADRLSEIARELKVSIESGLEGRNNKWEDAKSHLEHLVVSIESGLEGRNNKMRLLGSIGRSMRLNRVRPRRPEQWRRSIERWATAGPVSIESGLEGRNNGMVVCPHEPQQRWSQ